jgi:hypothetical protein
MEKGDGRKLAPKVIHDRLELDLPLTKRAGPRKAAGGRQ